MSLESETSRVFAKHSIAYWLHTYRRLWPGGIGQDKRPQTVGLTRAVFEAALQKYGTSALCTGIGESKKVPIEAVLGGVLLSEEFDPEKRALENSPNQLVLT